MGINFKSISMVIGSSFGLSLFINSVYCLILSFKSAHTLFSSEFWVLYNANFDFTSSSFLLLWSLAIIVIIIVMVVNQKLSR